MILKNFAQISFQASAKECWRLYNLSGNEFYPFTDYNFHNIHESNYLKREGQAQIIAKFLDYLEEIEYFKKDNKQDPSILNNYKSILRLGHNIEQDELKLIANNLNFIPCNAKQWIEQLKIVDGFLDFCKMVLAKNKDEKVKNKQIFEPLFHEQVFNSFWENKVLVDQYSALTNLKNQNEVFCPDVFNKKDYHYQKPIPFPLLGLPKLLENTSCYRDMAIYALMAGTGINAKTALSLKKEQVDFEKQKINLFNNSKQTTDNNSGFFDKIANVLIYDLSKIAKKDKINNALLYDLSKLKLKEHLHDLLLYDLEKLKLTDAMSNVLFYDLNKIKTGKLSDILLYDLSNLWKSKKNKKEIKNEEIFTQQVIVDEKHDDIIFIPGLKQIFFEALDLYYKKEIKKNVTHDYVFQFLVDNKKGEPYHEISREGFIHIFQKTVKRASILNQNSQKEWTPNSLKHLYGSYLLNYYPTMHSFGLEIEIVKEAMGHQTLSETKKYITDTKKDLMSQREYLNNNTSIPENLKDLNFALLEKYALILDKIKLEK